MYERENCFVRPGVLRAAEQNLEKAEEEQAEAKEKLAKVRGLVRRMAFNCINEAAAQNIDLDLDELIETFEALSEISSVIEEHEDEISRCQTIIDEDGYEF